MDLTYKILINQGIQRFMEKSDKNVCEKSTMDIFF